MIRTVDRLIGEKFRVNTPKCGVNITCMAQLLFKPNYTAPVL